ncbi:MAG: glycosyltransferase [Anaerolineae bacterium]|nr:MAG: glycosyltransferase [Anaerolineae bacterium]
MSSPARESTFPGRLALQQRVLPEYRVPFFTELATRCAGGLTVFAGRPRPEEGIATTAVLPGAAYTEGRNVHRLAGPLYTCRQPGLLAWLAAAEPAALIVEANPRYPDTLNAIAWMKERRRPVLGWGLGAPPLSGLLAAPRLRARLRLLDLLDGVIAYSEQGAAEYRDLGLQNVFVAHNAAAHAPVTPPPVRPDGFEGAPVVLFVGRLQARKRIDLLLRACAALPAPPRLVVVGDGPARGEFEYAASRAFPAAEFVGACHGEDLDVLFRQADLFVLPGSGGLAVQQAMSHGLPIISAEGDGTQNDLVRPGRNGWLVAPGSLDSLQSALVDALADPVRLRACGRESYRIVAEEINVEKMAEKFIQAVNTVNS